MTKLSRMERCVFLLTLIFLLTTIAWFLYQNQDRELMRIMVDQYDQEQTILETETKDPAPGLLEGEKLNINTAPEEELIRLPGIGPVRAESIVAHREAHGFFQKIEDIMQVSGIGEKTFEKLSNYITIHETIED